METTQFDTKPLLRPRQVDEARSEIAAMEEKLKNPHIEDKGEVAKQLRRVRKNFEDQAPRPPADGDEEGRMVARSKALLAEIIPAMCSQEEMRKAPPGAVDKFMLGEGSPGIKRKILEWKNLQLRLRPAEREAANLERHRPVTNSLNMDNAVVPGKMIFLPPDGAGLPVAFNDSQIALLRQLDPRLADMLATLPNEARAEVKEVLTGAELKAARQEYGKRGGHRKMSEAQKAAMAAGRKAAAAKKRAAA